MKRLLVIFCGCLFFSCGVDQPKIIENQNFGGALGTSYKLTYLSNKALDFQQEIDSVFAAVNQSLSTYIPHSDISKINRGDSTIVVDEMFQEVFTLSKEIHSKTKGYFDPTVGVLVNAWGFGPEKQITMDSTRVDSLLHYVGFEKVSLTPKNTIKKADANIRFDFNAIAKGYAIDRLAVFMDSKGIEDYLLEVGGEVVVKGVNKLKNKSWSIGIEDPKVVEGRQFKHVIALKNRALASSGNYRHFRVDSITGIKYVHTVDPTTGYTKNGNTLGVNVLAATCAMADAYATAFMAMDLNEAVKLLMKDRDLDAYIIYVDDKGKIDEFMTKGFRELVVE